MRTKISASLLFLGVLIVVTVWQSFSLVECGRETHAPNFSLKDLSGENFQLKKFRGKVVILDFMATWCGPCKASMPELKAVWTEYGEKTIMISIGIDPLYDNEERLKAWVNSWNATWTHARDLSNPPVSQLYSVTAVPTYIIIDKDGCIRYKHVGLTSAETISEEITILLNE